MGDLPLRTCAFPCAPEGSLTDSLDWNALLLHMWLVWSLLCSYLALTSKADVARVESKTYICTAKESEAHPIPKEGVKAITANWRDPQDMRREIADSFNGCMQGELVQVGWLGAAQ